MNFGGYSLPMYLAKTQMVYPSVHQSTLGKASWGQVSWNASAQVSVVIGYPSTVTSATIQTIQNQSPVNITPTINGSNITFPYTGTGQVKIEVNGDVADPIYLFANPLEVNPPSPTGSGVQVVTPGTYSSTVGLTGGNKTLYFGPGQYFLNNALPISHLGSGQSIYAADGAFIYGSPAMVGLTNLIAGTGSNISVTGRGVFDLSKCPSNYYITALSIFGTTATATTGTGAESTGNTFVGGESITLTNAPSAFSLLNNQVVTVLSSPAPTASQFQFMQSSYSTGTGSGYTSFEAEPNGGLRPNILLLSGGSSSGSGMVVDGVIFRDSPSITATISAGVAATTFTYNNVKVFGWRVNSDGIDLDGANGSVTNSMFRVYDDGIAAKSKTLTQTISSLTATNNFLFVDKATALKVGTETVNNISGVLFQGNRISSYSTETTSLFAVDVYDQGAVSNITFDHNYVDVLNQPLIMAAIVPGANSLGNGNPGVLSNVTFSNITSPTVPQSPAISLIGYGPGNEATGISFLNDTINGAPVTTGGVTANPYASFTVSP